MSSEFITEEVWYESLLRRNPNLIFVINFLNIRYLPYLKNLTCHYMRGISNCYILFSVTYTWECTKEH